MQDGEGRRMDWQVKILSHSSSLPPYHLAKFSNITNLPRTKVDHPASTETMWQMYFRKSCVEMRRIVPKRFMTFATLPGQARLNFTWGKRALYMIFATFSQDKTKSESNSEDALPALQQSLILPCSLLIKKYSTLHFAYHMFRIQPCCFMVKGRETRQNREGRKILPLSKYALKFATEQGCCHRIRTIHSEMKSTYLLHFSPIS